MSVAPTKIPSSFEADVSLDSIQPHPDNPRQSDMEAIKESVMTLGFYGAVVCQRSTRYVIAGSHRWLVLKESGGTKVDVYWLDVDDELAKRIMLADNRTSDKNLGYDQTKLAQLLRNLATTQQTLFGTGWTLGEMDDLELKHQEVIITEKKEFTGGYVETPEQQAERAAAEKRAMGVPVREIMLAYPQPEYDVIVDQIKYLAKRWELKGTMLVFQKALGTEAEKEGWHPAPAAPASAQAETPVPVSETPEAVTGATGGVKIAVDGKRQNTAPGLMKVGDLVTTDFDYKWKDEVRRVVSILPDSTMGSGYAVMMSGTKDAPPIMGRTEKGIDAAWAIPANVELPL
jgi:ParB-like nuclease family protein